MTTTTKALILSGLTLSLLILYGQSLSSVEAKVYETDDYSVNIPKGCKTEDERNRFSSDMYFDCKSKDYAFQFEMAGAPYTGADVDLPDKLLSVIEEKWYVDEEVERGIDKYILNNKTAPYVQATFQQEFTTLFGLPGDAEDWVYMVVGIKTDDDMLYAQFKSSEAKFDRSLKDFEKVLDSIKFNNNPDVSDDSDAA